MFFVYTMYLTFGVILTIAGLGLLANLIKSMIDNRTTVGWGTYVLYSVITGFAFTVGILMILRYFPLTINA